MKSRTTPTPQLAHVQSLPHQLAFGLRGGHSTMVLDVRPRRSFDQQTMGLAEAVPVYFGESPVLLPDLDRDHPLLVYCDSEQQASSNKVAEWLIALGYRHVWVMEGGLSAWTQARSRSALVSKDSREAIKKWVAAPAAK